ncbi:unnamed protein product [Staurois parvus]|uniref:Uncharacterized protein n=1 Tax=Staurois parvus TaxID=386267 RepID=A0ABN9G9W7_9NEOB|nr:unnamed protein product [Staurois parvus]
MQGTGRPDIMNAGETRPGYSGCRVLGQHIVDAGSWV